MMKKAIVLALFILTIATASFGQEYFFKGIKIVAPKKVEYVDAIMGIINAKKLLTKYGFPNANLVTTIAFEADPLKKFTDNYQVGYTVIINRNIYIRDPEDICKRQIYLYNTKCLSCNDDFIASIVTHELIHVFLMHNHASMDDALQEFPAYSIGIEALPKYLLEQVLKSNVGCKPLTKSQALSKILFLTGDGASVRSYLFWISMSVKERHELLQGIINKTIKPTRIGE